MNFSWIIPNKLAASSIPEDEEDIIRIKSEGIQALLCLVEEDELNFGGIEEYKALLNKYKIELKHYPIEDFGAPSLKGIIECVEWIKRKLKENKKVLVHCYAGQGRTGTIISCFLMREMGMSAEEAINYVRSIRPGSVRSYPQILAIRLYERFLNSTSPSKP